MALNFSRRLFAPLALAGALVACGSTPGDGTEPEAAELSNPSRWSNVYYPGWVQQKLQPTRIDYSAFTHVFHFGMYPDSSGNVQLADMQSSSYPTAAVKAAHAAKRHIVLVIGGEGQGAKFLASTKSKYEAKFVHNIVSVVKKYGYDGVDVDWEENVDEGQLVAFVKDLRSALDRVSHQQLLTLEVDTDQVKPSTAAQVANSVDAVSCMCYWDDGADSFAAYVAAGVPAGKFIKGLGFSSGFYDSTQARVQSDVNEALADHMLGVGAWQVGDLSGMADPRLIPLRAYVAGTSSTEDDAGTPPAPPPPSDAGTPIHGRTYPLHTNIISTTFWVGEIFDPSSPNGSQVFSTYDSKWEAHYGGCDGDDSQGKCTTETRTAANGYFPLHLTPKENPFYLDLPYDDLNNAAAFKDRGTVVPWANDPGYAGHAKDASFSYLKNRWVKLTKGPYTCYGQNEDAGPAGASDDGYDDELYVFGSTDARPKNKLYNNAGLDVSPALNGCLHYSELDGEDDKVTWQFVDDVDVPDGPWKRVVTTSQVTP